MSESSISPPVGGRPRIARAAGSLAAEHGPSPWLLPLLTRLHFYIGLFVGPFLLIAALSGIVYALTPQLEDAVYHDALYTDTTGTPLPLNEQILVARRAMGDDAALEAVRPAPRPGTTTRVMFTNPALGPSESRAVFVDPVSGDVRGTLGVYGTSGVLPLRSWLDRFHRGLLLGDVGRLYSETAASWLWLLAIGGLVLWFDRRKRQRKPAHAAAPAVQNRQRLRRWHGTLGAWAFLGVVFFSITGLTWSNHAGGNIGILRAHYGWGTPSVSTALPAMAGMSHEGHGRHGASPGDAVADEHAEHHGAMAPPSGIAADPAIFDAVLQVARGAGIQAGKVEIRPPRAAGKAWTVTEIDRSWPTRVDAVAVDPRDMSVIDRTRLETFPLAAKLTRWGIDLHMGALFGLPNQLLLIAMASCLTVMVVWGYMMWWRRRPTQNLRPASRQSIVGLARKAPWPALLLVIALAVALGAFLPVMGASLAVFLLWDAALQWRARATSR